LLRKAHSQAAQDNFLGTDDAVLVERLGIPVKIVQGNYQNIKITTPEDLIVAGALLNTPDNLDPTAEDGGQSRVGRMGIGYDVHRLVEGRKLIIGGVEIPYPQGLEGHSDADVLLHAIKDAMLGAAGLGDIGRHFPDSDVQYKGISSLVLLTKVRDLISQQGWQVNNVDAIVIAEKPKLAPFIALMNHTIAAALGVETDRVNIKATTTEGLGFTGRREGIASQAIVSLARMEEFSPSK
jgi:2-C-methyl-D-erythritol 4-phosphate cytidylyltransferase/2-C-methyl-D-erythritol 2,4-cyclodiphosphate synthase